MPVQVAQEPNRRSAARSKECVVVYVSGAKCRRIGPNLSLEVILRILTACGERIPIQARAGAQYRFGMELPSDSETRSPVVFHRARREELLSCNHYIGKVRIGLECVGNAGRLPN